MAEEEKKNEVVEAKVEEKKSEGLDELSHSALVNFVLACVGFTVGTGWIVGGVAGLILCIISLNNTLALKSEPSVQPYRAFHRIAKPVAIVGIVLSAVAIVAYTIKFIVDIVHGVSCNCAA